VKQFRSSHSFIPHALRIWLCHLTFVFDFRSDHWTGLPNLQDNRLLYAECVTTLFSMQASCQPQSLRSRRCLFRRGSPTIQVFLLEETPHVGITLPSKLEMVEFRECSNFATAQSFQVMLQRMHRRLTSKSINLPASPLDFQHSSPRTSPEYTSPRPMMVQNTARQRAHHMDQTQSL